jgi:hypothetical protein
MQKTSPGTAQNPRIVQEITDVGALKNLPSTEVPGRCMLKTVSRYLHTEFILLILYKRECLAVSTFFKTIRAEDQQRREPYQPRCLRTS